MKQIVANVPCSCDEATAQHADAIFMQRMEDAIGSFGDAIQFFRGISMCFRFTACKLSSTWWLLEIAQSPMGVPRAHCALGLDRGLDLSGKRRETLD